MEKTQDAKQGEAEFLKRFMSPPASSTQIPFWFLNGEVDGQEYARQVHEMATHGVRQAMPHPRFGMDRRDYLTEKYFKAFEQMVAQARKDGSIIHLYDEYNWPSGSAGGQVTADVAKCALGLGMRSATVAGPQQVSLSGWTEGLMGWGQREQYLAAVVAPRGEDGSLDLARAQSLPRPADSEEIVSINVPEGRWEAMVFYTIRTLHPSPLRMGNGGIIDYLAEAPVQQFIQLTHEQYARRLSEHFGSTIQSVFYDECGPYASGPFAWTADFLEQFERLAGYDLMPVLPLLFFEAGPLTEKVRCDYWNAVSLLFSERFIGQMADWCSEHNLALTGHSNEEPENWMLAGDLYRTLRRQQWPGMDALFGPARVSRLKLPASVSHVGGSNVLVCEAMGLLGQWQCSPRMIRESCNRLAAVGVTHLVPHAFFQTVDNPKVECPPSFFEHNPYWKYYQQIADLTARQCWTNQQGHHVTDVAVFYPIVSWWSDSAGGKGYGYPWSIMTGRKSGPVEFTALLEGLVVAHLDPDVVDGQGLAEATFADGAMRIAAERYRVLVIPAMRTARLADMQRIAEFCAAGGKVILVGSWPAATMDAGRDDGRLTSLTASIDGQVRHVENVNEVAGLVREMIESDVTVVKGDGSSVLVNHRRDGDRDIYMVANVLATANEVQLRLRATGEASLLCAETGESWTIPVEQSGSTSTVSLRLSAHQTQYVVFAPRHISDRVLPPVFVAKKLPLDDGWRFLLVPRELDTQWRCDTGEQIVGVPVFRTWPAQHEPQPGNVFEWDRWHGVDYDDHDWEVVHVARGPLLYSETGSRLFRVAIPPGADAVRWPLPVEKEHAVYVNGKLVKVIIGHQQEPKGWLDLPQAVSGGVLAIECASMASDFGIVGEIQFRCRPVELPSPVCWSTMGLNWYTGRALYSRQLEVEGQAPARAMLDLGDVRECAEIWVNAQLAGTRIWPPYRLDIAPLLRRGSNRITIIVSNLLANRFSWDVLGTRGRAQPQPSGLLGPVSIEW